MSTDTKIDRSLEQFEVWMNRTWTYTRGTDLSFHLINWGANVRHLDNPVHRHSFYEICYVLDGVGEYTDDGVEYKLAAGTVFCSRPGVLHQIRSQTGLGLVFVSFEVDERHSKPEAVAIFKKLKTASEILLADQADSAAVLMWRALLEMTKDSVEGVQTFDETTEAAIRGLLLSLFSLFVDRKSHTTSGVMLERSGPAQLAQARLFIRDNLAQRLSLGEVANYLHISTRHLSRQFASLTGMSFTDYVRQERIRMAKELLESTDLSLKQIAEVAGFGTIHYFTRIFSQEMGQPPGKYRSTLARVL